MRIVKAGEWLTVFGPKPDAAIKLLCFPYAGGSASLFRSWAAALPGDVEISGVELPGRGGRMGEMPATQLTALGVLMNTRGLMELIVLNIGLDLKVITPTLFAMLVLMAIVTTVLTTPVLDLLRRERRPSADSGIAPG